MLMTFEKGEPYYIKFLDHVLSDEHILMECEIMGWVLSQDKDRVTVTYWNVLKESYKEGNDEPVNIIKSTILKKRKVPIG